MLLPLSVSSTGLLNVTVSAPTSTSASVAGIMYDATGAVHVDLSAAVVAHNGGMPLTGTGALAIELSGTPAYAVNGMQITLTGRVMVNEQGAVSGATAGIPMTSAGAIATNGAASFSATLQSSAIASAAGSPTPTFTRATTKYVLGYAAAAVIADGPVLIQCASGEVGFTGARRISEGVWSSYDANGVFLSTTNGASALCCDASGPFGYNAEGARTNLCTQSQFASGWGTAATTLTANQYAAPDGTTTMARLLATAGSSQHLLQSPSITHTAVAESQSFCVRYVNHRWFCFEHFDGTTESFASFDLLNGVSGAVSAGVTSTIEPTKEAGVYLVTMTKTSAAGSGSMYLILNNSDTASRETWNAAGTEIVGVWGAQCEAGAFASSYIPTTTAAVTRNIDVDQYVSASNLSASAMTMALDWTPNAASMGTVFLFGTYVDANNYTAILHDGTNVIARKRIAGVNSDATRALAYTKDTVYRIVARFDATNGVDVWVAGTKGTGDATLTASQIGTNFQIGCDGNGANSAFGSVRRFAVYPTGLTDAQAAAL